MRVKHGSGTETTEMNWNVEIQNLEDRYNNEAVDKRKLGWSVIERECESKQKSVRESVGN